MPAVETQRSIVNTWECDENVHMNVQFYFAHFDTAARHFAVVAGLDEAALGPRRVRHVRYHSEMRVSELVAVRSAVAPDGPHPFTIVHEMFEPATGRLAATAVDGYDHRIGHNDAFAMPLPEAARPRSFEADPVRATPDSDTLLASGGIATFRGAIHPRHCDATGAALDQSYISSFTDGVPHVWEAGGMRTRWLGENGFGRVALEMKLSIVGGLKVGDMVHMVSCYTGVERKTLSFRHHLFETRSGRLAAVGDVTGVVLDLATRKSVVLPDDIRAQLTALIDRPTADA